MRSGVRISPIMTNASLIVYLFAIMDLSGMIRKFHFAGNSSLYSKPTFPMARAATENHANSACFDLAKDLARKRAFIRKPHDTLTRKIDFFETGFYGWRFLLALECMRML
ncbi:MULTISPECIES: hypothetical protein [unclassified Caballeronia]|nr:MULTISPECIES: hypothetical protein [unclassified Caballeronia]MDR5773297.1 hypothetical protein [Caballeronia sp. LZ002]MDR5848731.1 hypothetical protein [Caballeronia sp. LZ003]